MSLRPCRPATLTCLMVLLAACGGGSGSGASDGSQSQGSYADVLGWLDLRTHRVSLTWTDVVPKATRYEIEQQDASGAWVVIDAVWATHGQAGGGLQDPSPEWQGIMTNTPTTLRVEAVTPSSRVPLQTLAAIYSGEGTSVTFAPPALPPSIQLDQPEPLEQPTRVTLDNVTTNLWGSFSVDRLPFASQGTLDALTLDPGTLTTGTHVIYAMFEAPDSGTFYLISRSVQTHNSKPTIGLVRTTQDVNGFGADLLATSDAGIASMVASVDGVPIETVPAPNACVPQPCAAGQPFNGYHVFVNTQNLTASSYALAVKATDNTGNTASYSGAFNLPAPAAAVLDSPADGAVVSGTLHVSGTFSSGAPGALEVMATLSGAPVYDKTVANMGVTVPFAGDISLAGVAPGYHLLGVYVRVGNAPYTPAASILVQVATAP